MAGPIGIDPGSSGSVAAVVDAGGVRLLVDPLGEAILPSAVHFGGDEVRVGEEARIMAPSAPAHTIYDFMPLVGRPFAGATCQRARATSAARWVPTGAGGIGVAIGEAVHPLTGLAAMLLSVLRNRAPGATAGRIAVPATAGPGRRRAMRAAAQRAGFTEVGLVSAPLAAAVEHGAGLGGHERVWVVDLGAAQVEVALVEGDPTLVDLRGARSVAGASARALDRLLTDDLCAQCERSTGIDPRVDPAAVEVLRREAERARGTLGLEAAVDVRIAALLFCEGRAVDLRARLDARTLDAPIRRLAAGVAAAVDGLRAALDLAADALPERLVLVGGLALSPAVRAALAAELGIAPDEPADPWTPLMSVARGAALVAAGRVGQVVVDGAALPLRVGRSDTAIVVPGGMPLPLTMGCTVHGGASPVRVWHGGAGDADHLLGELMVEQPARVTLELDGDGILEVRVEPLPEARWAPSGSGGQPSSGSGGQPSSRPPSARAVSSRRPAPMRPVRRSRGPGRPPDVPDASDDTGAASRGRRGSQARDPDGASGSGAARRDDEGVPGARRGGATPASARSAGETVSESVVGASKQTKTPAGRADGGWCERGESNPHVLVDTGT